MARALPSTTYESHVTSDDEPAETEMRKAKAIRDAMRGCIYLARQKAFEDKNGQSKHDTKEEIV